MSMSKVQRERFERDFFEVVSAWSALCRDNLPADIVAAILNEPDDWQLSFVQVAAAVANRRTGSRVALEKGK